MPQLFILNIAMASGIDPKLPIHIAPLEIHSPYFQTLKQNSPVFTRVNYEITQDSEGFLWFAGYGGLARFDGYEIRDFKHDPNDKNSIAENSIRTISADNNGGLWLSLYNLGLSHYNAKTKEFTHLPHDKSDKNTPTSNTIRDIIVLENNDLWVGGKGGLSYYHSESKTFSHFTSGTNIKNDNYILDMTIDQQGTLWLSTARGLKVFDKKLEKMVIPALVTQEKQQLTKKQQSKLFRKVVTALNGKIWLAGFQENIHILDPETKVISPLPVRDKGGKFNHMSINQINKDEIWVSNLTTGIEVFNANTLEKINHIHANNKKEHLLQRINVDVIYTDNTGTVWLSFNGESPQYYNQNLSAYQYIQVERNENGEGILRVESLNDSISLFSISKHLALFDIKKGKINFFKFPLSKEYQSKAWEISVLKTPNNTEAWLGLTSPILIKFDLNTEKEEYYSFEHLGLSGNTTYDINYISDHELIISTSGGAIMFNPQTEKFRTFQNLDGTEITSRIWDSYKSKDGTYLLASNEGLFYQLEKQKGFSLKSFNKKSFKGSTVESLLEGNNGELWVITNQALYKAVLTKENILLKEIPPFKNNTEIFQHYSFIDKQGNIWFGAYLYYNPYQEKYVNLAQYNVFGNKTFLNAASLNDMIYLNSDKEFLIIDKNAIQNSHDTSPIRLTELTSGEENLKEQQLGTNLIISAHSQEFSVKFSALDFTYANSIVYKYRLKGLDNFWRMTASSERRASYTSIPPGDYTLEIKAQHDSGEVEYKRLSIPITVLPKYYQTLWFKLLMCLILACALWLLHNAFLKRAMSREKEERHHQLAIERAEMMEDLMNKKNQLLADVSHELGTPLTVLKLQVESLQDNLEEDVQVTYNALAMKLSDIQNLINDIHQLAQSDVGALQLNFSPFELNETLDTWEKELKQFVQFNKLSFEINRKLPSHLMVNFDRERLKQVFTNLLSNSIKYTDKPGKVKLSAKVKRNHLVLSIEDSAPSVCEEDLTNIFGRLYRVESSRSRETGGSGLGLAICKSLIKEHKGEIYAEHSKLGGIKVTLKLPMSNIS